VEDEAIFQSDIEAVVRQYMFQQGRKTMTAAEQRELTNKVIQDLVNDKLVIAQAKRLDVDVTFSDVEEQVKRAIDDNIKQLGGEEAFARQMEREQFTLEDLKKLYREQLRNRMLVERVLQMEMASQQSGLREEELRAFYESRKNDLPKRAAVVHLRTILIGVESSSGAREIAREKIDGISRRIKEGEAFEELARNYSQDPSAPLGGDLGFLRLEDLREKAFSEAAAGLADGEVSDPVLTSYGYHIIKVYERRPAAGEVHIGHILVRVEATEEDIGTLFRKANELHTRLEAGEDFATLADEYSDDPTAGTGGDLGWLKVADLPEFFQDVLAEMTPGQTSQVLREAAGFRIVKLVDREAERPYGYDEVRDDLARLYQQEQMSQNYAKYIAGLREKFDVDIKTPRN